MPLNLTLLIPIEEEKRATLSTKETAAHLGLANQTLRMWACYGSGPIQPIKVQGRLRWPVKKLALILGVAPHEA